jgi:hypothetical protein
MMMGFDMTACLAGNDMEAAQRGHVGICDLILSTVFVVYLASYLLFYGLFACILLS